MHTNVHKYWHNGARFAKRACEHSPQCSGGCGCSGGRNSLAHQSPLRRFPRFSELLPYKLKNGLALNVHICTILERIDFVELGIRFGEKGLVGIFSEGTEEREEGEKYCRGIRRFCEYFGKSGKIDDRENFWKKKKKIVGEDSDRTSRPSLNDGGNNDGGNNDGGNNSGGNNSGGSNGEEEKTEEAEKIEKIEKKERNNSWYKKIIENTLSKGKQEDKCGEKGDRNDIGKDCELEEQLKETLRSITSLSTKVCKYESMIEELEKKLNIEKAKHVDKMYEKELKEKEDFVRQKISMLNEKDNLLKEKELDIYMREKKMNEREILISKKEEKLNVIELEYIEKNKEKEKLHFEIVDVKMSLEKLKYEIDDKKKCLENIKNKMLTKENMLNELNNFMKEKNKLIDSLNEKINEKENVYNKLGIDIEEKRKIIELLDSKVYEKEKYFEEKIKELEKEQNNLVEKLNSIKIREKDVEMRENNFLHMEDELNDLKKNFSKNNCQLKIYKMEIKDLSNSLVEKEREILEIRNLYSEEITALKEEIKKQQGEGNKEKNNFSHLDTLNRSDNPSSSDFSHFDEEKQNQHNHLCLMLKKKEEEIENLRDKHQKEIDTIKKELNEKRKELVELKNNHVNDINNLNEEIEESAYKISEMKDIHKKELNSLHTQICSLNEEKQLMSNDKFALSAEINKLNEEKHSLKNEKDMLSCKINELSNEISTLSREKHTLSNDIDTLSDMITKLKSEISISDNEISKLKDEIATLNGDKEGKEKLLFEMEKNYKNEISLLKEKLKAAETSRSEDEADAEAEVNNLRGELDRRERENEELREDYDKKTKKYLEELQKIQKLHEEELNNVRLTSHEREQKLIFQYDELMEEKSRSEENYFKLHNDRIHLLKKICSKIDVTYSDNMDSDEIVEKVCEYTSKREEMVKKMKIRMSEEAIGNNAPYEGNIRDDLINLRNLFTEKDDEKNDEEVMRQLRRDIDNLKEKHEEETTQFRNELLLKEEEIKQSNKKIEELNEQINTLNDSILSYKEKTSETEITSYVEEVNRLSFTLSELKRRSDEEKMERESEIARLVEEVAKYKTATKADCINCKKEVKKKSTLGEPTEMLNFLSSDTFLSFPDAIPISESDMEGGGNLKTFLAAQIEKVREGKRRKITKIEREVQVDAPIVDSSEVNKESLGNIEMYTHELEESRKVIDELKSKICDLTEELMDLKNVKNELTERNNQLKEIAEEGGRKSGEVMTLEKKIRHTSGEVARLSEELANWREAAERLEADVQKWREEAEKRGKEKQTLEGEIKELKNSVNNLNSEFYLKENNYMMKLNENIGVIQNLKDSINEHKTELTNMQNEKNSYINEINSLKNKLEIINLEYYELNKNFVLLKEVQKRRESKDCLKSSSPCGNEKGGESVDKNTDTKAGIQACKENESGKENTYEQKKVDNLEGINEDSGVGSASESSMRNCIGIGYDKGNGNGNDNGNDKGNGNGNGNGDGNGNNDSQVEERESEISRLRDEVNRLSLLYSNEINEKNSYDIRVKELTMKLKELEARDKENKEMIASLRKMTKVVDGKKLQEREKSSCENPNLENNPSTGGITEKRGNVNEHMKDITDEKKGEVSLAIYGINNSMLGSENKVERNSFRLMKIVHESKNVGSNKIVGSYLYSKNEEDLFVVGNINVDAEREEVKKADANVFPVVCILLNDLLNVLFLNESFSQLFEKINKTLWKHMFLPEEIKSFILRYFNFLNKLRDYIKSTNDQFNNEKYDDFWFMLQNYLEASSNIKREMIYFILEKNEEELYDASNSDNKTSKGRKITDVINFSKDKIRLQTIAQLRKELNFERKAKIILNRDYHLLLYKYHDCLKKLKRVKNMVKKLNLCDTARGKYAPNREINMYSDSSNENGINSSRSNHSSGDEYAASGFKDCVMSSGRKKTELSSREHALINNIVNMRRSQRMGRNNTTVGKGEIIAREVMRRAQVRTEGEVTAKQEATPNRGVMLMGGDINEDHIASPTNINNCSWIQFKHTYDLSKMKNIYNEPVDERRKISFVHRSPFY
ncbi:repetitive organellar protein, putative (ROPE) [Plasmodium ovale wallikeri]|uniref:Repetitive organellar protein, putative (ROPE) n=1 Tax=Plasmodium ovale wallikeri TaxID=864142 RepID=A0A1A8YK61_PLAOA|nr:repetitive organellar protein, putative (ROPE) [Plasmodium ovale wallikeri]